MNDRHDVAIVGAGLAGLSAARHLSARGLKVLVFEAREEVGGRTRTRIVNDGVFNYGAEWVGYRHIHARQLVKSLGLHLESSRLFTAAVYWRGFEASTGRVSHLPPWGVAWGLVRALWRVGRMSRQVDPYKPWETPNAASIDAQSVASLLDSMHIGREAQSYLSILIGMLFGVPPERMSLLHLLWLIRRCGGPLAALYTTFQWRISEGSQAMANCMAEQLGGLVLLETPVTHIRQGSHVEIETKSGKIYRSKWAIVTAPVDNPSLISYEPALPEEQEALADLEIGPGTKVSAVLPADKLPRQRLVLGGSPLGGAWRYGPYATGFALPGGEREEDEVLIADLANAFGVSSRELSNPTVYRWDEQSPISGCDIGFTPGQLCRHGPALAQPHGRIGFAGSERSSWPDNMEGAIESGLHCADWVLKQARNQ